MMHIGAALKKPIIAVWGSTVPQFGMSPYYGNHKIPYYNSEIESLKCRPCSKIGYEKCPKGHFKCMREQNPTMIVKRIEEIRNNSD